MSKEKKVNHPKNDPEIVEFDFEENFQKSREINDNFEEDPRVLGSVYNFINTIGIE